MATIRKTITLSEQQDAWVRSRIDCGDFTNDSEYFRDLIRRDQMQNAKFLALQRAIQDGLVSTAASTRGELDAEAIEAHREEQRKAS